MCGIFGIFDHDDAATITALGLHSLQHRGQEACGIVTHNQNNFYSESASNILQAIKKISSKDKKTIVVFGSLYLSSSFLKKN